jgi:thiol-disulfide isomerase/thioredoxin
MKIQNLTKRLSLLVLLIALKTHAYAQQLELLNAGDPAPSIKYSKWIKGDPISSFDGDQLYILEFWATWCSPCKAAMPHLTELQKKYKGKVSIIGVNVWEQVPKGKNYDHSLPSVVKYVKGNESNIGYSIFADDNDHHMVDKWLKAAGQNGIPSTFIIKNNIIQWIGHPSALDSIIPAMIDGKYDLQQFRNSYTQRAERKKVQSAKMEEIFTKLKPIEEKMKIKEYREALELLDKLDDNDAQSKLFKNVIKTRALLRTDLIRAQEFVSSWEKEYKSAYTVVFEEVRKSEDLSKETYLWAAHLFDKHEESSNPYFYDGIAACFARGGDFRSALLTQEKAVIVARKAFKEGKMIGTVMDYTATDLEVKVKEYRALYAK